MGSVTPNGLYVGQESRRSLTSGLLPQWETVIRGLTDGAILADQYGNILSINASALELFGCTNIEQARSQFARARECFDHRSVSGTVLEPADWPLQRAARSERFSNLETQVCCLTTGRTWYASYSATPVHDDDGDLAFAALIVRDITAQRRAAPTPDLGSSFRETRFQVAVEASPSGVLLVEPDGTIAMVNTQAEKLFGYTRAELTGASIDLLVPERFRDHHAQYRKAFFQSLEGRPMGAGRELHAKGKNGNEFPVEISLNPIEMAEGTFVLATIIDVTERRRASDKLERQARQLAQADRRKDNFLAMLGHELRNPLAPIQNAMQVLKLDDDIQAHPKVGWSINVIERQLKHLSRLVDDLLDVSRIARGKL